MASECDCAIFGESAVHIQGLISVNQLDLIVLILKFSHYFVRKQVFCFEMLVMDDSAISIAGEQVARVSCEPNTSDASAVISDDGNLLQFWLQIEHSHWVIQIAGHIEFVYFGNL